MALVLRSYIRKNVSRLRTAHPQLLPWAEFTCQDSNNLQLVVCCADCDASVLSASSRQKYQDEKNGLERLERGLRHFLLMSASARMPFGERANMPTG